MRLQRNVWFATMGVAALVAHEPLHGGAADTNGPPHFQELFRLLRAHLPNTSDDDLNRAAVQGLLSQFYPRVILDTNGTVSGRREDGLLTRTAVYDQSYACLRVARVATGLADQVRSAFEKIDATNRLKGVILDLRFAAGDDYTAAANVVDRFLTHEQPLLEWDDGSVRSTAKTDAIRVPVAVLVNQQTAGSAEALAAALREADTAVLIGSRTAGQAHVFKEFDMSNGQRLRIATGQVRVGKGKPLSETGVVPDIEVAVPADDEKAYFADAFQVLSRPGPRLRTTNSLAQAGSTNLTPRRRVYEADLVRMQREGSNPDERDAVGAPGIRTEEDALEPVVRDPALARALDLLKGIAIVERSLAR